MAIEQGTETVTLTKQERTWRTTIESAQGQMPVVTAFRESVSSVGGDVIARDQNAARVERSFANVQADTVTVGGKTYTGAEIATVIPAFIDKWREQDMAAAVETAG